MNTGTVMGAASTNFQGVRAGHAYGISMTTSTFAKKLKSEVS